MTQDLSNQSGREMKEEFTASFSRRAFLRGLGTTAISAAAIRATAIAREMSPANAEDPRGPGPVPVTLTINGSLRKYTIEPRLTLLEVLRDHAGITGAKEACGRATCGACTVLLSGRPVYACMMLAIDVGEREVTTVEGLGKDGMTPIQAALVAHDGLQCGYCTSGFVMSLTALSRRNPRPSKAEVKKACSGHLCRCGSYPNIFSAALDASGQTAASSTTVIRLPDALA